MTKRKCRSYDIYNQSKCSETFKNPLFFHKRGENVKYYKNLRQKKIIDAVNKLRSGQTYDSGPVCNAMVTIVKKIKSQDKYTHFAKKLCAILRFLDESV